MKAPPPGVPVPAPMPPNSSSGVAKPESYSDEMGNHSPAVNGAIKGAGAIHIPYIYIHIYVYIYIYIHYVFL